MSKIVIIFSLVVSYSCSDASFKGNDTRKNEYKSDDALTQPEVTRNIETGEDKYRTPPSASDGQPPEFGNGIVGGKGEAKIELTQKDFLNKCWFAVSGSNPGFKHPPHADTFPNPSDGGDITAGSSFDVVGGVFLHPRKEPYVYEPGSLIEKAVDATFDGIIVSPGLKVIIKDKLGKVLVDAEGPYLGGSSFYETWNKTSWPTVLTGNDEIPDWIKTEAEEGRINIFHAHGRDSKTGPRGVVDTDAQWVQVAVVEGGVCDVQIVDQEP